MLNYFKKYDLKRYSFALIAVVILLSCIGTFLIRQVDKSLFSKQIIGIVGGLLIVGIVSLIDYHFICNFYIVLYFINLGLLLAVRLFGVTIYDAQRWLDLKVTLFQPSELSKIIFILFFAKLFVIFKHRINNFILIISAFVALMIPTYLILQQPDLSTSLVIIAVFLVLLFAAGLSWKIILPVLIIGIPSFLGIFWYVQQPYQSLLKPYQQERILSLLHPEEYPEIMYQQDNAKQAIGSGQLLGKMLTEGNDGVRGYHYVPVSESDFIFTVAAEELGFIGGCIIILLYALIVVMCLITAKRAPDQLGMLIAIGIASWFAFQVFVNIGVTTSLLPNTGIPLPFLSQGLSSVMSGMIAIGVILNIRLQPKKSRRV